MKKKTTLGKATLGICISPDKIPYSGCNNIWGKLNEDGEIIYWEWDNGGHFERDFTAKWTEEGYKVNSITQF